MTFAIIGGSVVAVVLLIIGKVVNDLVWHLARKCNWKLANATWQRYWIGGVVAAALAYIATTGFVDIVKTEDKMYKGPAPGQEKPTSDFSEFDDMNWQPRIPSTNRPSAMPRPPADTQPPTPKEPLGNPDTDIMGSVQYLP